MRAGRMKYTAMGIVAVIVMGVGPGMAAEQPGQIDTRQIAEEAYIYAFPW